MEDQTFNHSHVTLFLCYEKKKKVLLFLCTRLIPLSHFVLYIKSQQELLDAFGSSVSLLPLSLSRALWTIGL